MFHFVKLRHNVTVFTRDDPFHMGDVMHPYFWKGFRCSSWKGRRSWLVVHGIQHAPAAAMLEHCPATALPNRMHATLMSLTR